MTEKRSFFLGPVLVLGIAGCGSSGSDGASSGAASSAASAGGAGGGSAASATGSGGVTGTTGGAASGVGGGSGGSSTAGGSGSGGSGGGTMVPCTFTADPTLSEEIPTVGIVTWSTDLLGVDNASIDFGRDTTYGMRAPVDLAEPNYRTLLLGMKASTEYHFRITAGAAGSQCQSQDFTVTTGPLATGLPDVDVETSDAEAVAGGFLITGQYQGQGGGAAPAYILDADGDIVWWYSIGNNVTGARMSYDGKYMWINGANVPESQGANVHRVTMDGLMDENLSLDFTGQNHQLTVLPDETVAFYAYGNNGCDDVKLRAPDGTVTTVINARDAHGVDGACHVNAIEYSPEDNTLVFSDLDHDNYTKVTLEGEVVWVLGGDSSHFDGAGAAWSRQHGVDVLGLDRFLIFNNGSGGGGEGSLAIEILLDFGSMTATRAWTYAGGISNAIMGDVQRLDNGNTIVAYSTQGVLHEVGPDQTLLQELSWPIGGAFGYVIKRQSLYGPPPR